MVLQRRARLAPTASQSPSVATSAKGATAWLAPTGASKRVWCEVTSRTY